MILLFAVWLQKTLLGGIALALNVQQDDTNSRLKKHPRFLSCTPVMLGFSHQLHHLSRSGWYVEGGSYGIFQSQGLKNNKKWYHHLSYEGWWYHFIFFLILLLSTSQEDCIGIIFSPYTGHKRRKIHIISTYGTSNVIL